MPGQNYEVQREGTDEPQPDMSSLTALVKQLGAQVTFEQVVAVRAKFTVVEKTQYANESCTVKLLPVTGGSAENDLFFKYTPGGHIELYGLTIEAADRLQVKQSYYVDFTPAE